MDDDAFGELKDLLAGRNDAMDLDRAALALATIEFPGLDADPYLQRLDAFAAEIAHRVDLSNGPAFVNGMNRYLLDEAGLKGNADDYYNPHNSCVNRVLDTGLGIPITLSLVYIEVARRLAKPVHGIGLPRHFIVQYDDGEYSTFIDPFHEGDLLTVADCYVLAGLSEPDASILAPAGKRQILFRMIKNLRGIYFSRQAYNKAMTVLDLLIEVNPHCVDEYKQRALLYLHGNHLKAARADLTEYVQRAPEADDRAEMEEQVRIITRRMAALN